MLTIFSKLLSPSFICICARVNPELAQNGGICDDLEGRARDELHGGILAAVVAQLVNVAQEPHQNEADREPFCVPATVVQHELRCCKQGL